MKVKTQMATAVGALAVALGPAAGLAEAASPPSCVSFNESFWKSRVEVHNGCRSYQRVKIVIRNYRDSPCKGLSRGQSWNHYTPFIHVDRLERC